jgi:predicted NBD/HSP70 family sugar kinase
LHISVPAVSRVIETLINEGYVIETEKIRTENGKLTSQYKVNSEKGIVIGIDLIKEHIEIAVSNLSGEILYLHHGFKFFNKIDVKKELINEIEEALKHYCQDRMIERKTVDLKGIGVGIPAVTDLESGAVVNMPLYGSLQGLNLKDDLEKKFGVPVYIENVVRLSALGEKNYGEGKRYKDIVFFEVSNGIGAGIIIDNHLVRGTYGSAGEIGFSIFDMNKLGFKIKTKGYLESIASVESIKAKAIEKIKSGARTSILDLANDAITQVTPAAVCVAAAKGDLVASEVLKETVDHLSLSMIQLILILNPEIIVLGGDICRLPNVEDLFLNPIVKNVERSIPFNPPPIRISSLGENAGVIGASCLAIETLLTGEFPYAMEYGSLTRN